VSDFHVHLDRCAQCREHPFDLCPTGAETLRASALGETALPAQGACGRCEGSGKIVSGYKITEVYNPAPTILTNTCPACLGTRKTKR
jgi:hypothetical protein